MLQIPSSALSLFSSSKGLVGFLGGFCIGAQVTANIFLSSLSVAKNSSLRATRTLEIILLPTKCDLSNGTISSSYVALIAYATVVFASLFCILRAKGFTSSSSSTCNQSLSHGEPPSHDDPLHSKASPRAFSPAHNRNGVGNHPPSPPPEPDSSGSTDKPPRRNSWLFWLLFLLLAVVLLLGVSGIYICLTENHSRAELLAIASPFIQHLSFLETGFFDGFLAVESYISTIKIYFSLHGLHYSKIFLFGIGIYCPFILIDSTCYRLQKSVRNWVSIDRVTYCALAGEFLGVILMASFSQLSWILWGGYYFHDRYAPLLAWAHSDPSPDSFIYTLWVESWRSFSLVEKSVNTHTPTMIIGPTIIQAIVAVLSTTSHTLLHVLGPIFSAFLEEPQLTLKTMVVVCTYFIVCCYIAFGTFYAASLYCELPPDLANLVRKYPFLSQRWRRGALEVYWVVVWDYREWKSTKIEELHNTISSYLSTLAALIVTPPAIYCTYFYISRLPELISSVIRFQLLAGFQYYSETGVGAGMHASVENRLALQGSMTIGDQEKRSRRRSQQVLHSRKVTRDRRRNTREAAGAAMGLVGDALHFSPPSALSPPPSAEFLSDRGVLLAPLLALLGSFDCLRFLRSPDRRAQVIPAGAHLAIPAAVHLVRLATQTEPSYFSPAELRLYSQAYTLCTLQSNRTLLLLNVPALPRVPVRNIDAAELNFRRMNHVLGNDLLSQLASINERTNFSSAYRSFPGPQNHPSAQFSRAPIPLAWRIVTANLAAGVDCLQIVQDASPRGSAPTAPKRQRNDARLPLEPRLAPLIF
ncbi:hypothetical protein DFH09DRAFT_1273868 [Mycena vulgaris]|nr:hypothetical protein DFH09DRAFT_1273868 [Mycena vulgaris]